MSKVYSVNRWKSREFVQAIKIGISPQEINDLICFILDKTPGKIPDGHTTGVNIPPMFGVSIYTDNGDEDFTVRFGDYLVKDSHERFFLQTKESFELCYELEEEEETK